MGWFKKSLNIFRWGLIGFIATGFLVVGLVIYYLEDDLPDVAVLNEVQLQTPLRIFTNDGQLIAEYGQKRRIPVPYEEIPSSLVYAVLATEDQRFFEHPGVDVLGLMRASVKLMLTGTKAQGGSTITMQVARNFFLTRKKTYTRKLKEILLAIKIDNELSKQKILDLYLNKIYLGNRAYGVGAAAQVYYGKNLNQLTLAQIAMIAGLPKAPSALNPLKNPEAAKKRRNHVLSRMLEQGHINEAQYKRATQAPITARYHGLPITVKAPYVAEMVRTTMLNQYGEDAYTMGLNVYTTVESKLQLAANNSLQNALHGYDRRHGYRGAIDYYGKPNLYKISRWLERLKKIPHFNTLHSAAVLSVDEQSAQVMLETGAVVTLPWEGIGWARKQSTKKLGPMPEYASDILKPGDVIYVTEKMPNQWYLAQVPEVEGAIVSLDPQNGQIKALVGGFSYKESNFNRAIQAKRQAGSSFKPFVYAAALNKGFTLASIINDAPIVISNPGDDELWRPQNDSRKFYGPTRFRVGLTKSRNLVSIRVLDATGITYALDYIEKFGFNSDQLPHGLSLALGAGSVSPLDLATGYSVFANGGYQVKPYIIDYISNSKGDIFYQSKPKIACEECIEKQDPEQQKNPAIAQQVVKPQVAYLMNSVLQDVIVHGTGRRVRYQGLNRADLAGKTGTTNDQKDAWFAGYNSDLVTVTWLGFDTPASLHEYGSKAALPMWVDYMKIALENKPLHTMPQPPNIVSIRIDPNTGLAAPSWQQDAVFEIFRADHVPTAKANPKNVAQPSPVIVSDEEEDSTEEENHLF